MALVNQHTALVLIAIGLVLGWISIHFNQKMVEEVKRQVPSKASGLRNLFETYDNNRVWREHKRLFPESRLKARSQLFLVLSATMWAAGLVVFLLSGRRT